MSTNEVELLELIRSGRKIDAIKLLRKARGLGLREATAEIERLGQAAAAPSAPRTPHHVDAEVRQLAQSGQRIAAIKLLRTRHRIGLKAARTLLDATVPPPPRKPLLPWLGLATLLAIAGAAYLLLR